MQWGYFAVDVFAGSTRKDVLHTYRCGHLDIGEQNLSIIASLRIFLVVCGHDTARDHMEVLSSVDFTCIM